MTDRGYASTIAVLLLLIALLGGWDSLAGAVIGVVFCLTVLEPILRRIR